MSALDSLFPLGMVDCMILFLRPRSLEFEPPRAWTMFLDLSVVQSDVILRSLYYSLA